MVRKLQSSTLSSKGQITIPMAVRERLGLKEGDRVEFVSKDGETLIRPAQAAENPFDKFIGILPAFKNERERKAWIASMRDEEDD